MPLSFLPVRFCFLPGHFFLSLIFSLFGIAANRIKKYIGFNPIFITALWLPLEYVLNHNAYLGSIFTFSEIESTLLFRIASLFGLLMVSFLVVLINALFLIFSEHFVKALGSHTTFLVKDDKRPYPPFKEIILERSLYYLPNHRAPPQKSVPV